MTTPLVLIDKKGNIIDAMDEATICGEDICDRCRRCLHCLPDSSTCGASADADHVWIRYVL